MAITSFTPTQGTAFTFSATFLGPTANVSNSVGPVFQVTVFWSVYGQRWYFVVTDQNNNIILTKPLIASTPVYPVNLIGGYFIGSVMVYLESSQQFVVTP